MDIKPIRKSGAPDVMKAWSGRQLTGVADEALLSNASMVSEGAVEGEGCDEPVYAGTTMLTVDLKPFTNGLSRRGLGVEDLLAQLRNSILLRLKLMRLARAESEQRCAPHLLSSFSTELEFKIEQDRLLIDIDVIGALQEPMAETDGAEQGRV